MLSIRWFTLIALFFSAHISLRAQLLTWLNFATHNGSSNVLVKDIGGDASGNTFFLVQFTGSVNIDNITYNSPQDIDYIIVKRDVNENLDWTRRIYCNDNFNCRSICADSLGNVYVVGGFNAYDTVSFDASAGLYALPVFTEQAGYVGKYDTNGNLQWVKTIEGQASPTGQTSVDLNYVRLNGNSLFITGLLYGAYDFDPSAAASTVGVSSGNLAVTSITLFDLDGNLLWAKPFGSFGHYINYMCFTPDKDILIAGNLTGSQVDLNPGPASTSFSAVGPSDIFITRLDSMGIYQWTRRITGNSTQEIGGIAMFNDTNFIVCGITDATIDIDPTGDTCSITGTSLGVDFLALYNLSSNFISGGSVNTGLTPEQIFCNGFNEVILYGGAFAGHYGIVFADTSYQTTAYNSYGGSSPGTSASSTYFRFPFTLYIGGHAGGSNFYGNDGVTNVSVASSSFTGFTAKYFLGWGPEIVEEPTAEMALRVFPNPANDFVEVMLPDESSNLSLYTIDGAVVWQQEGITSSTFRFNTAELAPGIYLLKCDGREGSRVTRLVITRKP